MKKYIFTAFLLLVNLHMASCADSKRIPLDEYQLKPDQVSGDCSGFDFFKDLALYCPADKFPVRIEKVWCERGAEKTSKLGIRFRNISRKIITGVDCRYYQMGWDIYFHEASTRSRYGKDVRGVVNNDPPIHPQETFVIKFPVLKLVRSPKIDRKCFFVWFDSLEFKDGSGFSTFADDSFKKWLIYSDKK